MNCVLIALTHVDGKKEVSKALAMARDLAEPNSAEVRVLQVVEDVAGPSGARMAASVEAMKVPEMWTVLRCGARSQPTVRRRQE